MNQNMSPIENTQSKAKRLQSTEKTLEVRLQSINTDHGKHIHVSHEFLGGRFDIKG